MAYRTAPAASEAKRLLRSAARVLHTADPTEQMAPLLDESLPLPPGHHAYRSGRRFEPTFSETAMGALAFGMTVGDPEADPTDRLHAANHAVRRLALDNFGRDACNWLDARTEALRDPWRSAGAESAWLASDFDRDGVRQTQISYAWGPGVMESLPGPIFQVARAAVEALPGLEPAFSTIRLGRHSGSQQIVFAVRSALPLDGLKPLMDRLGLGRQHASLANACAFVLGARFTLPPDCALITLRPTRSGIELRLDVDLACLPDLPDNLASLLQLQLAERPRSLRALERWVAAFTPDGWSTPGSLSVLSVMVRPDMPARLALHLRPAVLDEPGGATGGEGMSGEPSSTREPLTAGAGW